MTKDYSQFFTDKDAAKPPRARSALEHLGWQPFFAQQTDADAISQTPPVRITEVHRNGLRALGEGIDTMIPPGPDATVGDWLLWNPEKPSESEVLHRKSLFQRRAAGHDRQAQMIAANVDTAFIVTSCNDDFNVARLERFISLAFEAEVTPVILLTKTDLCEDVTPFQTQAREISDRVEVVTLNALSAEPLVKLAPWCLAGQTVAFLGSSGVGKSTLVNALFDEEKSSTAAIREDDAKGRHTTTSRQLHFAPGGYAILDTPGMRELQLTDVAAGVADLFSDLTEIATTCRFNDCSHEQEPSCAILAGIADGSIDPKKVARWQKLVAEEKFNSATLAERRANDRSFGKKVRKAIKSKKQSRS